MEADGGACGFRLSASPPVAHPGAASRCVTVHTWSRRRSTEADGGAACGIRLSASPPAAHPGAAHAHTPGAPAGRG
jgi:hypothetical protein